MSEPRVSKANIGYNEKIAKDIVRTVRAGNNLTVASRLNGKNNALVSQWFNKGRNGFEPYVWFYEAIQQAKAEFEAELLENIVESGDPRHHLAVLSRMYPERWAEASRVQTAVQTQITDFLEYLMYELEPYPEAKKLVTDIASRYDEKQEES